MGSYSQDVVEERTVPGMAFSKNLELAGCPDQAAATGTIRVCLKMGYTPNEIAI